MLWSIDTCQNKVSADQNHVTRSWAQIFVFCYFNCMKCLRAKAVKTLFKKCSVPFRYLKVLSCPFDADTKAHKGKVKIKVEVQSTKKGNFVQGINTINSILITLPLVLESPSFEDMLCSLMHMQTLHLPCKLFNYGTVGCGYCSGVSFNLTMLIFCNGKLLRSRQ